MEAEAIFDGCADEDVGPTREVTVDNRASRERKEAGTMPSAVRGEASPRFTGAGSDLMVKKVSLKYL